MKSLEWKIAARYLRSRRSSRLVSLITLIATGGVAVGVTALVVVVGVMNGLQAELRAKILIASPHVRILTFGARRWRSDPAGAHTRRRFHCTFRRARRSR